MEDDSAKLMSSKWNCPNPLLRVMEERRMVELKMDIREKRRTIPSVLVLVRARVLHVDGVQMTGIKRGSEKKSVTGIGIVTGKERKIGTKTVRETGTGRGGGAVPARGTDTDHPGTTGRALATAPIVVLPLPAVRDAPYPHEIKTGRAIATTGIPNVIARGNTMDLLAFLTSSAGRSRRLKLLGEA
ncbi:hypothetical protein BT69DRAFT_1300089 [Atractiella rhizophila]|nr:hypothetical protein BT69DRAFT_1300089 [Atractiella rhizophila]